MASNSVNYIIQIRDRFSGNLAKFKRGMKGNSSAVKDFSKRMDKLAGKFDKFGRGMRNKLTLPIAGLGIAAGLSFGKMEKGLVDVINLLDKDEIKIFSGDLEELQKNAIRSGFSITESNKALFDTISALGAGEKAFETFKSAQLLAIGGNADLGISADGITTIMGAYSDQMLNAKEISNAFFLAQLKGKTTVEQLAASIGQPAAIAAKAKIPFDELLATLSAITLGGISTDESATSLKAAIKALINPTKDAKKILTFLGASFGASAFESKGLSGVLLDLIPALAKVEKMGGNATDVLFRIIPNIRAFTAVAALTPEKLKLITESLKSMKLGTERLDSAVLRMKDTLDFKFKAALGSSKIAMQQFFVIVAPMVIKLLEKFAAFGDTLSNLSPGMKKLIIVGLGILAVMGPLLILMGTLTKALILAKIAGIVFGVSMGVAFAWIALIPAAIAALILLQSKFNIFGKIGDIMKMGMRGGGMGTAGLDQNNTVNNLIESQANDKKSKVDIGNGTLTVKTEKGTDITSVQQFNPSGGLQMSTGGAYA